MADYEFVRKKITFRQLKIWFMFQSHQTIAQAMKLLERQVKKRNKVRSKFLKQNL